MRLELGRRTDYAIRAVLDLARHDGPRRKAREIVESMAIPESYVTHVMADLVRMGLVHSTTGPDGGYSLARPAGEMTLLQVIEAIDGPIRSTRCVLKGGPCRWDNGCAMHPAWSAAQEAMAERLGRTTFAELAQFDAGPGVGISIPESRRSRGT